MREEEFAFLGMSRERPPTTAHMQPTRIFSPRPDHSEHQHTLQREAEIAYAHAQSEAEQWLLSRKGPDVRADLIEERRKWILDVRARDGKFPESILDPDEGFYAPARYAQLETEEDPNAKRKPQAREGQGCRRRPRVTSRYSAWSIRSSS